MRCGFGFPVGLSAARRYAYRGKGSRQVSRLTLYSHFLSGMGVAS